jgi:respiratory-subunit NADH dehydrogenase subunit
VVLTRPAVPALVVPDEQTWTMSGRDPATLGVEPVFAPGAVRRVLVLEDVPSPVAEALQKYLENVPSDIDGRPDPPRHDRHAIHEGQPHGHDQHVAHEQHRGEEAHALHEHHGGDGGHTQHDGHEDHSGHDHHDMMAIVGEPSTDGLVMEPIELTYGPIGTVLPAGLVANVTLDGDVVSRCEVTTLLAAEGPDPLTPETWAVAYSIARDRARGVSVAPSERCRRIARIEIERALSHLAWLRSFARLLGWRQVVERSQAAITSLLDARSLAALSALEPARGELHALSRFMHQSRRLRMRARGRAVLTAERAAELGLRGPAARASGLIVDARLDDPLYRTLGFEPIVRSEGDTLARTLVRAAEAAAAIELAARALEVEATADLSDALPPTTDTTVVEGPRGPVEVLAAGSARRLAAHGHDASLTAASETAAGSEWASALLGLASFDLSPWRVGA